MKNTILQEGKDWKSNRNPKYERKRSYSPRMEPGVDEVNEEETGKTTNEYPYVIIIWHELQLNLQLSR